MRKIIYCTLILCFAWISNAYSTPLTAEHLYFFAKQKRLNYLAAYSKYINITNQNNDTALCIAVKSNDYDAYQMLLKYGASTRVNCLANIRKSYNNTRVNGNTSNNNATFLGMGKTGWLTTGAVVAVGAGVAAAAGGGGGGGSGENGGYDVVGKYNAQTNNNTITLKNNSNKDVYGMKNSSQETMINACNDGSNITINGTINIENYGNSNRVYGLYSFDGEIFNAYGKNSNSENANVVGNIRIDNYGDGTSFGLYSMDGNATNSLPDKNSKYSTRGNISIINHSNGAAFGISAQEVVNNSNDIINIVNLGNGRAYGLSTSGYSVYNSGNINIYNIGNGSVTGISGDGYAIQNYGKIVISPNSYIDNKLTASNTDDIIYQGKNFSNSSVYGISSYPLADYYHETINYGDIIIQNSKKSIGISFSVSGSGTVTNIGTIKIDNSKDAYGIFASNHGNGELVINNEGTIKITNSENATGIYASGENTIVVNTGIISINNQSCSGVNCKNNRKAITLMGGASFVNIGSLSAQNLSLNDFGGEIVATSSSSFIAEDDISGDLSISNNVVTDGFDTIYTVSDMIKAGDSSKLNLVSKSAMFDANLKNGKDAVMTMKSFNDVVENKSLANFLQKNYAMQNNEKLFSNIKSAENIKSLNNFTDQMFGKDMFSRFAFEDLMIMRELNFDINNKLFNNKEDYLSVGGNKSSFAFSGNSRYSLSTVKNGKNSIGISVAFSDINSDDGNNKNQRYDRMYNISMPVGFQANGLKFVSTPRVGYSYGTYERNGFDNQTYEGTVEKQMFAFMNETRYPIQVGGWNIAPSAELNFINYKISGHETDKEYSLKIKSQNNYSIEAGIGLYASKETKFSKDSSLRFNGGVALYHEFADPYKMKLGMEGMSGTFTLRDENRSDNRAVVQSEIEFKHNNFSIVGNIASYIDRKYETNTTLDFKFGF